MSDLFYLYLFNVLYTLLSFLLHW